MKVVDADALRSWIQENEQIIEPPAPPTGEFRLIWPTPGPKVVTQAYGINPQWYKPLGLPGHEGVDLRAPNGTPIFAVAAGTVYLVESNPDPDPKKAPYGKQVRIQHDHPDGPFKTVYAHFMDAMVTVGDFVETGQQIGRANNTGNSSGPHLHMTLKKVGDGSPWMNVSDIVNPTPYMPDLFPGEGWILDVGGNFRVAPNVNNTPIRYISSNSRVEATGDFEGDWWQIIFENITGWFWNPGYKLRAI